jgi:pyruvate dehydrogenase E1 component beta subunit
MAELTDAQAVRDALAEEMRRDEHVFILGEEVAKWGGTFRATEGLLDEFGEKRVLDTPIAEEVIMGLGVGAAMAGLRPVVEFMTVNFIMLAIDQIVNHAAKMLYMSGGQFPVPVTIRVPGGGGLQMAAQHSQSLEAWFCHVPGLKVVAPSTPADAKGLIKTAIRDDDPVMVVEHERLYPRKGEVPDGELLLPIGRAAVVREGRDVTLAGHHAMVRVCLDAAEKLEAQGLDAEVIDNRSLRPLDAETLVESVKKTGRFVYVEECWPQCGIGAEVSARLMTEAFDYLDAPVLRISQTDAPVPYSWALEKLTIPSADRVVEAVRGMG